MTSATARAADLLSRRATPAQLLSAILLVFAVANFLYGAVLTKIGPPAKNDFTSYYVAARVVLEGMPDALYYPQPVGSLLAQASVQHPWIDVATRAGVANPNYYLYPPLFAIAMLPLALVPYGSAFALWLGMNVLFLAASLWIFIRSGPRPGLLTTTSCVVVATTFYPVWHHLKIGQSSLLVLLLLTLTLSLLLRRKDGAAGLALSGAILLKLTPGLILVLLALRRRWRAVGFAAGGVAALSLLSSAVVGIAPQVVYFGKMVPLLGAGTAFYPNQSLNGFVTRLLGYGDYHKADLSSALGTPRAIAMALSILVVLVSIAAVARRRREAGDEALEDGFALLVAATLMVSPISWEHHYVILLLPAWILLRRWGARGARTRGAAVAAGAALALCGSYVSLKVFEKFGPGPLGAVLGSAAVLGGALLWWIFLRGRAAAAEPSAAAEGGAGRAGVRAVLIVLTVFVAAQFLLKVAEYNTSFRYGDFTSYYLAGAAVAEGQGAHLYAPGTSDQILAKAETDSVWRRIADERGVRDANYYLYPPFFAVFSAPLSLLPYDRAHDLWYLLNLGCLAGAVVLLLRLGGKALTAEEKAGAVLLTALLWPTLFTFGAGQANDLVLLLVVAGLLAASRGRDTAAGWALAGATAIKLTPALLLAWFLWKRRYRIAAWGAAGVLVLELSGLPAVGWEPYRVYVTEMVPLLSRGCAHWVNQSLSAFLSRLGGAGIFDWSLAPDWGWVRMATRAAALLFAGMLAWITRGKEGPDAMRLDFALVLVTTLFLSPISWIHHSILTLPAIFILVRHLIAEGRLTWGRVLLVAAGYALIAVYFKPPGIFGRALLSPLASYHLAGNAVIWSLIAAERLHLRSSGREAVAA